MKELVEQWDPSKTYNELNIVTIFKQCYYLTSPTHGFNNYSEVGIFPLRRVSASNEYTSRDMNEFYDKLLSEYTGVEEDTYEVWRRVI